MNMTQPSQPSPKKNETPMQRRFRIAREYEKRGIPITCPNRFEPSWYFSYGPQTDPATLASFAGVEGTPEVVYAKVSNAEVRYWGQTPALITTNKTGSSVEGVAWFVDDPQVAHRMEDYEPYLYGRVRIDIEFQNGQKKEGWTIGWVGYKDDLTMTPQEVGESFETDEEEDDVVDDTELARDSVWLLIRSEFANSKEQNTHTHTG